MNDEPRPWHTQSKTSLGDFGLPQVEGFSLVTKGDFLTTILSNFDVIMEIRPTSGTTTCL